MHANNKLIKNKANVCPSDIFYEVNR